MACRWYMMAVIAVLLLPSFAAGENRARSGAGGDRIYGQELLTLEERDAYRRELWERKTEREREEFRRRHREKMRERAANRGVPLLDETLEPGGGGEEPKRRADDGLRRRTATSDQGDGLRRWGGGGGLQHSQQDEKSWPAGRQQSGRPENSPWGDGGGVSRGEEDRSAGSLPRTE